MLSNRVIQPMLSMKHITQAEPGCDTPGSNEMHGCTRREFLVGGVTVLISLSLFPGTLFAENEKTSVQILSPALHPVIARAKRTCQIRATVGSPAPTDRNLKVELVLPPSVEITNWDSQFTISLDSEPSLKELVWNVEAREAMTGPAQLLVWDGTSKVAEMDFQISFTAPMPQTKQAHVPKPQPVETGRYLVGAMHCPLWKQDSSYQRGKDPWQVIKPYSEREPVLGFYKEGEPEVTDWEIKYAVEHGIQFFVSCWYRAKGNIGQPVQAWLEHWLKGFAKSRYAHLAKFALMWENTNEGACGVADKDDMLNNVLSYWIGQYFRTPSYLLIDGKPVVFLYGPKKFMDDLGGMEKTRSAIMKMREACVRTGFKGLVLLGCDNQCSLDAVKQMEDIGFDHSFSYHWPTFTPFMPPGITPDNAKVMPAQKQCWEHLATADFSNVVTVSMGWDSRPWYPEPRAKWTLTTEQFQSVCSQARDEIDKRPAGRLDHTMLLLDNWNEFGEGHYIFPTRQYGFGYLDAVRNVFSTATKEHLDIVPEDVGLGPYVG